MKRPILLAITALFCIQGHSQFKSLLNKVKDKVTNKITAQPKQKDTSAQVSQAPESAVANARRTGLHWPAASERSDRD